MLYGFLDRKRGVIAAKILGELVCEPLRRFGVEAARHIDKKNILGSKDACVERGGNGGINAA